MLGKKTRSCFLSHRIFLEEMHTHVKKNWRLGYKNVGPEVREHTNTERERERVQIVREESQKEKEQNLRIRENDKTHEFNFIHSLRLNERSIYCIYGTILDMCIRFSFVCLFFFLDSRILRYTLTREKGLWKFVSQMMRGRDIFPYAEKYRWNEKSREVTKIFDTIFSFFFSCICMYIIHIQILLEK